MTTDISNTEFAALVESNIPLVHSIAEQMKKRLPSKIEIEELFSIGILGLMEAARRFHPSRGGNFGHYAAKRIRGAILDDLRRADWMSRGARSQSKRLAKAITKLEQTPGGSVSSQSLCAEMDISEDDLAKLLEKVRPITILSLDALQEASCQDDYCLHDLLADDSQISALDIIDRKEMVSLLAQKITQLPELPRKVLAMHYYENMKLADIAACFGVTESRICQIHTKTVAQLRKSLMKLAA